MIFQLNDNNILFPDPALAEPDGLLAIGGDLSPERLKPPIKMAFFHGSAMMTQFAGMHHTNAV